MMTQEDYYELLEEALQDAKRKGFGIDGCNPFQITLQFLHCWRLYKDLQEEYGE